MNIFFPKLIKPEVNVLVQSIRKLKMFDLVYGILDFKTIGPWFKDGFIILGLVPISEQ